MFKSSRRKIVAAIMSILVVLWVGTLCVIYASSYFEVSERNREMLERHVALYTFDQRPKYDKNIGNKPGPHLENTPAFQLSTFYSVAISRDGAVLAVNNADSAVYDRDELKELAFAVLKSGKTTGIKNNLIYRMADKGGYTLVAFMDNTIMQESMTTLFRYTLIFGGGAIIALYFLAVYLAKRIVKPMEESYQRQKQFISDAGHELKTPVSVISANAELLSRELGENRWLSNIQYENERMGMLVCQLLELARTENVTPQTERIDFSRLVGGEALPFESVAFEAGLTLNCDIAKDLFVCGNSTQLKQLLSILLDNAIRHTKDGREVALALKEERNTVKLSVVNDGKEIPPEQRKQLFERFYRDDTARSGEDKHYGLGLAIAKAIVTSHNGKIEVLCYNGKVEFAVHIPSIK